jgi:hypothetical protein
MIRGQEGGTQPKGIHHAQHGIGKHESGIKQKGAERHEAGMGDMGRTSGNRPADNIAGTPSNRPKPEGGRGRPPSKWGEGKRGGHGEIEPVKQPEAVQWPVGRAQRDLGNIARHGRKGRATPLSSPNREGRKREDARTGMGRTEGAPKEEGDGG